MSYAQFTEVDSDVYVYMTNNPKTGAKQWICTHPHNARILKSLVELRKHLEGHLKRGDRVPDRAFERIAAEMAKGE